MKGTIFLATVVALALLAATSGAALADGVTNVAVNPLTPRPGDVITVKGGLLGANSTVEVRVVGAGVDVDLGEVTADAEGDFRWEFRLPADLAPGTYQLRAIGAKTAATELRVVAAGAATAAAPAPAMEVRERPFIQTAFLVAIFGVLAALGLVFARTAREQPGR